MAEAFAHELGVVGAERVEGGCEEGFHDVRVSGWLVEVLESGG